MLGCKKQKKIERKKIICLSKKYKIQKQKSY